MKRARSIRIAILFGAIGTWFAVAGKLETERIARVLPGTGAAGAPQVDGAALLADVRTLASPQFEGRKTGTPGSLRAQAYLQARFAKLGLRPYGAGYAQPFAFTRTSVKGLVTPGRPFKTGYQGANYVGYVAGSDPDARVIVISAHYDHLGIVRGKLYPGADDNASGVGAMLAMAAWFQAHRPRHTIVFAAFDAEELGLRGARAFMAALPFPREKLFMNLNLDMVSHNGRDEIFIAGTSHTPAFKPLVGQVALRSSLHVKLGHDRPMLVAGSVEDWTDSSDHGPFHAAGVPFLYFGVEDHPDYHAPGDTFEHINQTFYLKVASLLVDMAVTLDQQP
ncbi:MAG: M20/M25/M40 family metallo-hydrolase [Pseudomonadota bacterium]